MGKKASRIYDSFMKKADEIEKMRLNYEHLTTKGSINDNEISQAYAGLYLDLFTEFEACLDALFFGLLSGSYYSTDTNFRRKVRILPSSMLVDVVYGGKKYLDWIPYSETTKRAQTYFEKGIPFTSLDQPQKDRLSNLNVIRNAIAHKSTKAQNEFNDLIKHLTLLPTEKTPAGYLRSIPSKTVGERQLQIAATELLTILKRLCQ